jgi:hypothetical protein
LGGVDNVVVADILYADHGYCFGKERSLSEKTIRQAEEAIKRARLVDKLAPKGSPLEDRAREVIRRNEKIIRKGNK